MMRRRRSALQRRQGVRRREKLRRLLGWGGRGSGARAADGQQCMPNLAGTTHVRRPPKNRVSRFSTSHNRFSRSTRLPLNRASGSSQNDTYNDNAGRSRSGGRPVWRPPGICHRCNARWRRSGPQGRQPPRAWKGAGEQAPPGEQEPGDGGEGRAAGAQRSANIVRHAEGATCQ